MGTFSRDYAFLREEMFPRKPLLSGVDPMFVLSNIGQECDFYARRVMKCMFP